MQVSFRPEVERDARPVLEALGFRGEASSSRYAEPEAEGVTPVLRTGGVSGIVGGGRGTYTFFGGRLVVVSGLVVLGGRRGFGLGIWSRLGRWCCRWAHLFAFCLYS